MTVLYEHDVARAALGAIDGVFASLGRYVLFLDDHFRIVHAPATMRELLGAESVGPLEGRPIADLLGKELFGSNAPLRDALTAGERREGWRALLQTTHGIRPLAISAAPMSDDERGAFDARVRYAVMILPAEEDHFAAASPPAILAGLIARSQAMSRIFHLVESLQSSDAPVLLTGERGTGKEVVARAIHEHSPRRRGPFVSIECSALPPELLDSELFGHVRGAFAGAVRDRVGRLELAVDGTVFLGDVGALPLALQLKVLRAMQQPPCARIIAATTLDLRDAVACGAFREDLFAKLHVVPVDIPPLRARREDIEPLARLLLRRVGERHGRHLRLAPEVIRLFLNYTWPGNVQELETAIEYAVAVAKGAAIQPEDLPSEIAGQPPANAAPDAIVVTDSQRLRAALEAHRWRREETARALGMSRATLWRRMRALGLL
jgi:DNA-binding NtrC family response regulator